MREQLNSELKKSIINKDLAATKTIRLIIAAIKDRDIVVRTEGNQNGISDADIISLLKKMQKQREESIQLYLKGNRIDLVQSEISHFPEYDYVVINKDINFCVNQIKNIIESERLKRSRLVNLTSFVNKFRN